MLTVSGVFIQQKASAKSAPNAEIGPSGRPPSAADAGGLCSLTAKASAISASASIG